MLTVHQLNPSALAFMASSTIGAIPIAYACFSALSVFRRDDYIESGCGNDTFYIAHKGLHPLSCIGCLSLSEPLDSALALLFGSSNFL